MSPKLIAGDLYRESFRIVKEIGSGGTSDVYWVHHLHLNRMECLKKGRPDRWKGDLVAVFQNEQRMLHALQGPYVPQVYRLDNEFDLYMELLKGVTLDGMMRQWQTTGKHPPDILILQFACALIEVVEYAHKRDVILADIKPENLFIEAADPKANTNPHKFSIRLIDVGAARQATTAANDSCTPQVFSELYGAPEVIQGESPCFASDLYAFGAVLYALLSHQEPAFGKSMDDFEGRMTSIYPPLAQFVTKLLSHSRGSRPTYDRTKRFLADCLIEMRGIENGAQQSRCHACDHCIVGEVPNHCPNCNAELRRETGKIRGSGDDSGGPKNPIREMKRAAAEENLIGAIGWARQAWNGKLLYGRDLSEAIEVVSQSTLSEDKKLSVQMCNKVSVSELDLPTKRRFANVLGKCIGPSEKLMSKKHAFFAETSSNWPEDELLWCWYAESAPSDKRETIYREGLRIHREGEQLNYSFGNFLLKQGELKEALKHWMMTAFQSENEDLKFMIDTHALAQKVGDETAAEHLRVKLFSLSPDDPDDVIDVARLAHANGDVKRALQLVFVALETYPLNSILRKTYATLLIDNGKYDLALEVLAELGKDDFVSQLRGIAFFRKGDYQDAISNLECEPSDRDTDAGVMLVTSYVRTNQSNEAKQTLNRWLRAAPNSKELLTLRDQI